MEAKISSLCTALSSVLNHADDSSRALSDALSRRPIHLESAARGFLQGLERRSEAAGADLSRLESMAFGTVSFEELLGHCGEALAMFSRHADAIESRLVAFGYVPPDEEASEDVEEDWDVEKLPGVAGNGCFGGTSSVLRSSREMVDDDDALFENSMSLKNLGFSDACLATLSSQDSGLSGSTEILYRKPESVADVENKVNDAESMIPPKETNGQGNDAQGAIKASKEEYEKLPPYMKTLATWEELQEAISKLNSYFSSDKTQGNVALNQDDVGEIGLGRKGRSYLLILLRMNQLAMENIDGSIFYNIRKSDS
ncbi:uncharacterized protein [Oryza sativa Japonica Group]|uniref:Uncharacterized protein n=1 Tax=Oryza rufipogon TaxID=4529 RepID=A0A0E0RK83_ORYRU|nr:uncharacterized protein LOC9266574 [Oryza sativa Japonica Group]KAF2908915.1 hypothetical protein DAI22_12g217100 [Oryza sativa Japonica Group]